ncbi:pyruvate kinase [Holotrichia oblita]|nr:pyruvate kinase [Holotrichia oblita]
MRKTKIICTIGPASESPKLIDDVSVGSQILLDDGLIELVVERIDKKAGEIVTVIQNGGALKNNKKKVDFIALSFARRPSDILEVRELLKKNDGSSIHIIPKIENCEGVQNIEKILEVSDGLMVARGDLGVEIPVEEVPLVQKKLIRISNQMAKPVVIATQMLDSMQRNPRPTRAEASDVANAIFDGTDAIMLSGETAAGQYPVESVQTMASIAERAELALNYRSILRSRSGDHDYNVSDAIGQSVAYTAYNLKVKAIIAPTEGGTTARMISRYRPEIPLFAITSSKSLSRKLSLVWGVTPVEGIKSKSTDEMLFNAVQRCLELNLVNAGELVIITAGVPLNESGTTNMMKIHFIAHEIAAGQGIGRKAVNGKIVVAKTENDIFTKIEDKCILVVRSINKEMINVLDKCSAIIAEEGGLTSQAAIVGLNLGIPVIVGVDNATTIFKDGQIVTLYAASGLLFVIGLLAKNYPIIIATLFFLILKAIGVNQKFFEFIQNKGINWGVTVITIAVLAPVATGKITIKHLTETVKSPYAWIAVFSGIAVAILAKNGIKLLAIQPEMTVALVFGTIFAVTLFKGVAVGPIVGAGIAFLAMKIVDLFK